MCVSSRPEKRRKVTSPERSTCTTPLCPESTTAPRSEGTVVSCSERQELHFSTPSQGVECEDTHSNVDDEIPISTPSSSNFVMGISTRVASTPLSSAQSCKGCANYQSRCHNLRRVNGRLKSKVSNLQMEVSSLKKSIKELEHVSFGELLPQFYLLFFLRSQVGCTCNTTSASTVYYSYDNGHYHRVLSLLLLLLLQWNN